MNDFAVFILTHGRANNVITYTSLRRCGYTGQVYIIIDNEDKQIEEYKKNFGDKVIVFDKLAVANKIDPGDNFQERRAIIYARNASFDIAESLNIPYFIELDDDYTGFVFKFDNVGNYVEHPIKNLDVIFAALLGYFKSIPAHSIAMAQCGDFIGGAEGNGKKRRLLRKCMNSFFCSTNRKFKFFGGLNEDVSTYTKLGSMGYLFLTVTNIALHQLQTQSGKGGMTDAYLNSGTYVKSFYSVLSHPSSVTVRRMATNHPRLHHHVSWNNTVPKILHERHKKEWK